MPLGGRYDPRRQEQSQHHDTQHSNEIPMIRATVASAPPHPGTTLAKTPWGVERAVAAGAKHRSRFSSKKGYPSSLGAADSQRLRRHRNACDSASEEESPFSQDKEGRLSQ